MRKSALRLLLLLFALCLLLMGSALGYEETLRWDDPATGHSAVLIDELGLLSAEEQARLLEDMKPLTEFGSVAFWTTEDYASNEIEQARLTRRELFGFDDAAIFAVNMNIRKLTIQSYGSMYDVLTKSRANTITNNVRRYATKGDYYEAARRAFSQMLSLMRGNRIAQPMKHFSNACIALMLGLILMLSRVFKTVSRRAPETDELVVLAARPVVFNSPQLTYTGEDREYSPPSSDSGSSSGCSSCSRGCSSCGGGGSSSF